jgi:hypothetical protein
LSVTNRATLCHAGWSMQQGGQSEKACDLFGVLMFLSAQPPYRQVCP